MDCFHPLLPNFNISKYTFGPSTVAGSLELVPQLYYDYLVPSLNHILLLPHACSSGSGDDVAWFLLFWHV